MIILLRYHSRFRWVQLSSSIPLVAIVLLWDRKIAIRANHHYRLSILPSQSSLKSSLIFLCSFDAMKERDVSECEPREEERQKEEPVLERYNCAIDSEWVDCKQISLNVCSFDFITGAIKAGEMKASNGSTRVMRRAIGTRTEGETGMLVIARSTSPMHRNIQDPSESWKNMLHVVFNFAQKLFSGLNCTLP